MEKIKKQRQGEIANKENALTRNPLYVVYDQCSTVCEHWTEYDQSTSIFGDEPVFIRHNYGGCEKVIDADTEENWDEKDGKWSPVVKKFFHDKFITVCFTRDAAVEFIRAEKHNLNNPRIWVHATKYRNFEMIEVLKNLGD